MVHQKNMITRFFRKIGRVGWIFLQALYLLTFTAILLIFGNDATGTAILVMFFLITAILSLTSLFFNDN